LSPIIPVILARITTIHNLSTIWHTVATTATSHSSVTSFFEIIWTATTAADLAVLAYEIEVSDIIRAKAIVQGFTTIGYTVTTGARLVTSEA
jgi:hypothetical protein